MGNTSLISDSFTNKRSSAIIEGYDEGILVSDAITGIDVTGVLSASLSGSTLVIDYPGNDGTSVLEGDTNGQMLFWDNGNTRYDYTETTELIWDDTNKRLGLGTATPLSTIHIEGNGLGITIKTTGSSDPFIRFIDNADANRIVQYIDVGSGDDRLVFEGETSDANTKIEALAPTGQTAFFSARVVGLAECQIYSNSTGDMTIKNKNQDQDIIFYQNRGGSEDIVCYFDQDGISTFTEYIQQPGIYGGIHVHDGVTAQSIPNGVTYTKITAYTDNNLSSNVTSDATNDKITITKTGIYRVEGTVNFSAGTANTVWRGTVFVNGVEESSIHFHRKITTAGDVGSASFSGFIDVTSVPIDVDCRVRHDNGANVNITVTYSNLNVSYLGET